MIAQMNNTIGRSITSARDLRCGKMWQAILVATMLAALPLGVVQAATIMVFPADADLPLDVVLILGTLAPDDGSRFVRTIRAYAVREGKTAIMFNSRGGSLSAGIEIGRVIRAKRFATFVGSGSKCASACALAWLAGVARFLEGDGLIGFHAAYREDGQGQASESGVGNALVGSYLTRLGLPESVIVYVTQPSPYQMRWLNLADARQLGIAVQHVNWPKRNPAR